MGRTGVVTEGIIGCGLRLCQAFARLVRQSNQSVHQRRSVSGSHRSLRLWGKDCGPASTTAPYCAPCGADANHVPGPALV